MLSPDSWTRAKLSRDRGAFTAQQSRRNCWRQAFIYPRYRLGPINQARVAELMRRIPWVALAPVSVFALATLAVLIPPICLLPELDDASRLLGNLLTAQAAIAALTLAVTLFVMQGVSSREDVDDRVYREYVRRSQVGPIFWSSIVAVGVTTVILIDAEGLGWAGELANLKPGLYNVPLVAAFAFIANLGLAGVLFQQAIRLTRPAHWGSLKRDVNQRDVRGATEAFLQRLKRAVTAGEASEFDLTSMYRGPDEGSADEAIRAILDEARRAMSERRQGEFRQSLESIEEVVQYAMDEINKLGIKWGPFGAQPQWPPLGELTHNLSSFREEVISEGNRDYVLALLRLDYWLISTGVWQRCGDLFTAGLDGYRMNYQIATRTGGGDVREMLRERAWQNTQWLIMAEEPEEIFPYAMEMVRHQERFLSDAMHASSPEEYEKLHSAFHTSLGFIRRGWEQRGRWQLQESENLYELVEREYRIALMGLAGRAMCLADSGRIADPKPYLSVGRSMFSRTDQLANDISRALQRDERLGFSLWSEWDMMEGPAGDVRIVSPEKYPLDFFTVRLMELTRDTMPVLNLRGSARQVSAWFMNNVERLESHILEQADVTMEQRRALAADALKAAERTDEIAEDYQIIGRELSPDRVSAFVADVYTTAFTENPVDLVFQRNGALLYLVGDPAEGPNERGFYRLEPKAFLTDHPENARTYYEPLDGTEWGRGLSEEVLKLLCEALDEVPATSTSLETPTSLLQAIDEAIADLNPSGEIFVALAGNWITMEIDLAQERPEGYELPWQLPDNEPVGEMARYHGNLIIRGPGTGERRVYVVEPGTWGCLARGKFESDQELRVEFKTVSGERARELLESNPNHFASEADEESKIRKLQTCVEMIVAARYEFRGTDPSRARRIIVAGQAD